VWGYCEGSGLRGRTVTLKVKFPNSSRSREAAPVRCRSGRESELEQLGNALPEPLFPVAKGVRLLGVSFSSLVVEETEGQPEFSLPP
jgi:DNA polymerase-4